MTEIKSYSAPPINQREILRYLRADSLDPSLLRECLALAENELTYKVCFAELPLKVKESLCDFSFFSVKSADLAKNLQDSDRAIIFVASIGVGFDRLIAKYSRISPLKALVLDAIGNERVEALCDRFCEDIKDLYNVELAPRFSAGYGDLPLQTQSSVISILNAPKNIGVSLTESLLLTPAKSVTAFLGIKKDD